MKDFDLKKKICGKKPTVGSWITVDNESIAEIMARMGFDWLTVDIEHSAIDLGGVQRLVRIIDLNGCSPLVRVGENDPNLIKRVMDTGAHGVIVPMINTAEDARRAVASVKYPPMGKRGVGLSRAQGYGLSFDNYRQWLAQKSVVIAIIEHVDAIKNLEEILAVEGIDATMVGPYDLSGSMGHPGEFLRADVQVCLNRYQEVCRKLKKPSGFHVVQPKAEDLQKKIKLGYNFLAFGLDTLFLTQGIQDQLKLIHRKTKS